VVQMMRICGKRWGVSIVGKKKMIDGIL